MTLTKKKRSISPSTRKRTANHHRKSKHYVKAYWPYLPITAIVSLGILLNSWMGALNRNVLSYATNISVPALLDGTNSERSANGLGALTLNSKLCQAAEAKAADMSADNYWAHNAPTGETPWTFITAAGYSYLAAGENLAYGFATTSDTITGWMNSPGHRANILNGTYSEVGFAIINIENYQNNGNQTLVVAMYGSPYSSPVATPAPEPAPAPPAAPVVSSAPTISTKKTITTTGSQPTASSDSGGSAESEPAPTEEDKSTVDQTDVAKPTASASKDNAQNATDDTASKSVKRIELLTSANVAWTSFALSMVVSLAVLAFLLRHSLAWHKVLVRGENFIIKHPLIDISIVAIATLGAILLQTSGVIK